MKKIILFILILCIVSACNKMHDFHLQLHIDGIQYDSLLLIGENTDRQRVEITGNTIDSKIWNFIIPDSIYNSVDFFSLYPRLHNLNENTVHDILSVTNYNGDTLSFYSLFLDRQVNRIYMKYLDTQFEEDMLFYYIGTDSLYTATLRSDRFIVPWFDNTDFALRITYPSFGDFYSEIDEMSYQKYLDQYIETVQKHPYSRYLMAKIARNLQSYKAKEDLQNLYNAFSEITQQTSWGKMTKIYIQNYYTFSDTLLPTWDTGVLEPIILDSKKINLVVFSASWCIPCHEQIPILKEIYTDLKDFIDIIYISQDKPETVDSWRKLMQKENIPWRSLLTVNDVTTIRKKYNAQAIPYVILVYPENQRFEIIDVRISEDINKLYSLCGQFE